MKILAINIFDCKNKRNKVLFIKFRFHINLNDLFMFIKNECMNGGMIISCGTVRQI